MDRLVLPEYIRRQLHMCIMDRPKSTPPGQRKRLSDLWMALNTAPEMKDLAAKSGFELVNVGLEQMDAFMKERTQLYTEGAARLGLGKK